MAFGSVWSVIKWILGDNPPPLSLRTNSAEGKDIKSKSWNYFPKTELCKLAKYAYHAKYTTCANCAKYANFVISVEQPWLNLSIWWMRMIKLIKMTLGGWGGCWNPRWWGNEERGNWSSCLECNHCWEKNFAELGRQPVRELLYSFYSPRTPHV